MYFVERLKCFLYAHAKAIAGFAAAAVINLANRYELTLGPINETVLAGAFVSAFIYFIPNEEC